MIVQKIVCDSKEKTNAAYSVRREAVIRRATVNALLKMASEHNESIDDVDRYVYGESIKSIMNENTVYKKSGIPEHINIWQTAQIALYFDNFRRITFENKINGCKYDVLGLYIEDGADKGTYSFDENDIRGYIHKFSILLTTAETRRCASIIMEEAPRAELCTDPDLIAVNNGIFNYKTKELMPFSKDYVFLSKVHIDYYPNPVNPVIHNDANGTDWDIESWMNDTFNDADMVDALWKIAGACVRPNVLWNQSVWLYANMHSDDCIYYGLLTKLASGIWANISATNMDKPYFLTSLVGGKTIIANSDSLISSINDVKNLKPLVEGTTIQIGLASGSLISYEHKGIVVEYVSDVLKMKSGDKFYKNQIYMCFEYNGDNQLNKMFYRECINRKDVLEYVLHKVLHMNDYYKLSYPFGCKYEALQNHWPVHFD